tara:strand:- start:1218 stop:1568 length:351 start_codon:yes stop_codon:yes gene_type:complete
LDVGWVALFVLRGLLSGLVELLVDRSSTSHYILLDTAQSSKNVIDEIKRPLLDGAALLRRDSTSQRQWQKPRGCKSSAHSVDWKRPERSVAQRMAETAFEVVDWDPYDRLSLSAAN